MQKKNHFKIISKKLNSFLCGNVGYKNLFLTRKSALIEKDSRKWILRRFGRSSKKWLVDWFWLGRFLSGTSATFGSTLGERKNVKTWKEWSCWTHWKVQNIVTKKVEQFLLDFEIHNWIAKHSLTHTLTKEIQRKVDSALVGSFGIRRKKVQSGAIGVHCSTSGMCVCVRSTQFGWWQWRW